MINYFFIMNKKIKILLIILSVIIILELDVMVIEPNFIVTNEIYLKNTGNEMKIIFLADFQRRDNDPAFVQRVVDIINEQNPDLILLGGDYIEKSLSELPSVEPLRKMESRFGTFAVMGNHDYDVYWYAPGTANLETANQIEKFLTANNTIQFLSNQNVEFENINVIGLDSYWSGLRNDTKSKRSTEDFTIVLTHNQDDLEINKENADLYLFGHTHCGQVRLPGIGSIPKAMGFRGVFDYQYYLVDDVHVYTTCGLTTAPRFLNPPEIAIINLT